MTDTNLASLCSVLQLVSPQLPIGGFSYSQGLEAAIEHGVVHDAASAQTWIGQALQLGFAQCEAPLWYLQWQAWQTLDAAQLRQWDAWFLASRDNSEARAETLQMGWSLRNLLVELQWGGAAGAAHRQLLQDHTQWTLPTVFAAAVCLCHASADTGLMAFGFTWLENQVAAAIKAIPLGQVAGQKLLLALHPQLLHMVEQAKRIAQANPPALNTLTTQWSILQARHEHQYSRLFRS